MYETEADTCRKYVLPKLYAAGWTDEQINEQHTFTDGRIVPTGNRIRRRKQKRADYRLRIARDFPIAIVEAKASYKTAGEGLQQAKDYATILDLKFAYATNGTETLSPKQVAYTIFPHCISCRWHTTTNNCPSLPSLPRDAELVPSAFFDSSLKEGGNSSVHTP